MLKIEHLTKNYGHFTALKDLSLEIGDRQLHGFVGPNGAGKTTTMRIIATLLKPTSGRAVVNGADVQWKSSDVEVATVDADGTVHPVGFGGAIISAECITADGSYLTASCEVKVIGSYYISLNGDEGAIEVSPKETFNFTPTVRDYDGVLVAASEDEFTYGSLNQDIVAYENGKFVAKAIGETVVYAEYKGAVGLKTVTVGTLKAEDFTVISGIGDTGVTVGADGYWVYKGVSGVDFDNACGVMGEKWRQFVSAAKASGFGKITVTVYEIKGLLKFRPYNTDSGLLGTANKVLRSTDCSYEQPYVTEINVSDCEDWSGAYLGMDKDGEFVFLITLE